MRKMLMTIAALALTAGCLEEESKTNAPAAVEKQSSADIVTVADMEAGGTIAAWCSDCHGSDGISTTSQIPHLAGQRMDYVVNELQAYKDGDRDNPAMRTVVESLNEDAMRNVAAYYSLRGVEDNGELAPATGQQVALLDVAPSIAKWTLKCNRCHEAEGFSDPGRFPILTGQREEYLVRALHAYQNRFQRASSMMHAMTEQLTPEDIQNISAYYAHRPAVKMVGYAPQD